MIALTSATGLSRVALDPVRAVPQLESLRDGR